MSDRLMVVASFLLVFAFSSVDSAISPMVREIGRQFSVAESQVLLLISSATAGVVTTVLVGPALTASYRVGRLFAIAGSGMALSLGAFLVTDRFDVALVSRFGFGLSCGLAASCLWWLTFYGVSRPYFPAMITVLMSARPLATAIGVPLAGWVAASAGWRVPLAGFGVAIVVSGAALAAVLWGRDEGEKSPFGPMKVVRDYGHAFALPWAGVYYIGFTINRMCYFGFYALAGIWFSHHFKLGLLEISRALFYIGLGEAVVNFAVPKLLTLLGHRFVFLSSLAVSCAVLPLWLGGSLGLGWTIALITLFMILDRVYCTALVVSLPRMFPYAQNKTVFGSLNTLTAWAGLTLVSWLESRFLDVVGLVAIQHFLLGTMVVGSLLLYVVQAATVLGAAGTRPAGES